MFDICEINYISAIETYNHPQKIQTMTRASNSIITFENPTKNSN